MPKFSFPWLALGVGLFIALLLLMSAQAAPGEAPLPLLTRLILAEFGFIVNVVGSWFGLRALKARGMQAGILLATVGCVLIAVVLGVLGMALWPEGGPGLPVQ